MAFACILNFALEERPLLLLLARPLQTQWQHKCASEQDTRHDCNGQRGIAYLQSLKFLPPPRLCIWLCRALEGITTGDIGDVYEKFNAAKSLLDPQWRPEVDLAFNKAMLEYKSGNLGRNLVYL